MRIANNDCNSTDGGMTAFHIMCMCVHVICLECMRQPLSYNVNALNVLLCNTNDSLNILQRKMKLRISVSHYHVTFMLCVRAFFCVHTVFISGNVCVLESNAQNS